MNDAELVIAIRLWLDTHERSCGVCSRPDDGCLLAQRLEDVMLDLGATDLSPLEPRS